MRLFDIHKRTVEALHVEFPDVKAIGEEFSDGVDKKRPCFFVKTTLMSSQPVMATYGENKATVFIDFYPRLGRNQYVDCEDMAHNLNCLFALNLLLNDTSLLIENKDTELSDDHRLLRFSFDVTWYTSFKGIENKEAGTNVNPPFVYKDDLEKMQILKLIKENENG